MKASHKHFVCFSIALVLLLLGACSKNRNAYTAGPQSNTDSLHYADSLNYVDSIRRVDSIHAIDSLLDSTVGRFYCTLDTAFYWGPTGFDSIIGYDTVTVVRSGGYDILVNGERFTYRGNISEVPYLDFSNGILSWMNYVRFYGNYDSIEYLINYRNANSLHTWRRYSGSRIH